MLRIFRHLPFLLPDIHDRLQELREREQREQREREQRELGRWLQELNQERERRLERERELERERQELERERHELERERQEHQREREREREAKRSRRRLRKQLALLKDVITRDVLLTKNLHSLLLAMLLFALFLELLGWFILVGLFATVLIYLLLIIHLTFMLVKNLKAGADAAISRHSTDTSPGSLFSVWSRKLSLSLYKSPNTLQWHLIAHTGMTLWMEL